MTLQAVDPVSGRSVREATAAGTPLLERRDEPTVGAVGMVMIASVQPWRTHAIARDV